jgi:hypothetical protein
MSLKPGWRWPAAPPPGYLGQLDDAFQRDMAERWAFVQPDDCVFYHAAELPSGEVIPGAWYLLGEEDRYLGQPKLGGKRVLELGPASGCLTWWMERQGAEVVGFDVGFDVSIDMLPAPTRDLQADRLQAMQGDGIVGVQNSWWYMHRELGSAARIAYGDIYRLPTDFGRFDVSVFGALLIHLRDPYSALAQAAAVTDQTMIVVEPVQGGLDNDFDSIMRFDPVGNPDHPTNWWALSPGAVVTMLKRLGFGRSRVERHRQRHHLGHRLDEPPTMMEMYTVIADRG